MGIAREIFFAFRPKTLTAALVPCLAGSALAFALWGQFQGHLLGFALAAAFLIQIATNFINDAVDFVKGADTAERVGPRRMTQAGILSSKAVLGLGFGSLALAIACGIPLVLQGGWPIVIIGLISVAMAYSYTAGPFPLAYLGLGDLFVVLFFGIIAVAGMTFLHVGEWGREAIWLGLQIGFHATVLIAINNARDAVGDAKVGKKTLAVRFGLNFSRAEILVLTMAPFLMNVIWWRLGFPKAAILPLFVFPLAFRLVRDVFATAPGPAYNGLLARAALVHLAFGLLLSLGLVLK